MTVWTEVGLRAEGDHQREREIDPPLSARRAAESALVSRLVWGGSSAGQSSGLIIRQVVGSNPTRPTV